MRSPRNTEVTEAAPKNRRRTPEQLARFHREETRKNEQRFAAEVDIRVAQATTIIKKLDALAAVVDLDDQSDLNSASEMVEKLRARLVKKAVASHLGSGTDDDPDFQVKT